MTVLPGADEYQPDRSREYPLRPIVGVGGVVLVTDRETWSVEHPGVVLIRRRYPPMAGSWSLPGGTLEVGETLTEGLAREVREETGLDIDVGALLEVFDRMTPDGAGRIQYHYVLIDYVCRVRGGTICAGSDVTAAEIVDPASLEAYELTPKTLEVIHAALARPRPSSRP